MKKIKKWLLGKSNYALAFILAHLGVSCSEQADMYGSPYAKFEFDLEVTDESGKAVPHQDVVVRVTDEYGYDTPDTYNPYRNTTLQTDENGKASQEVQGWISSLNPKFRFVVGQPVDESLAPDSVSVASEQVEKQDGWYEGKFKASAHLILKKKQ